MSTSTSIRPLPSQLARAIDYTDVRKEVTYADVETLCLEGSIYGVKAVVVPSMLVSRAVQCLGGSTGVSCFIGYPFGTQSARVKAREAEDAAGRGAAELDVVPHFGALRGDRWSDVESELRTIRRAGGEATLKLVLEAPSLRPEQIERVCALAADVGYALVSNTIGFRIVSTQPETEGSATAESVRRLAKLAGRRVQVKAVGGVSTREDLEQLLHAGAVRVALTAQRGILRRWAVEVGES